MNSEPTPSNNNNDNLSATSPPNEKDIQFENDYGFSRDKIRDFYCEQNNSQQNNYNPHWDFYDERQFIENLFVQRFNFLTAYFTAVPVAAFAVSDNYLLMGIIFLVGSVITLLMGLAVHRAYVKTDMMHRILYKLHDFHPFPIISKAIDCRVKGMRRFTKFLAVGCGVNSILGVWFPLICPWLLLTGAIYSFFFHNDSRQNVANPNTQAPISQTVTNDNTIISVGSEKTPNRKIGISIVNDLKSVKDDGQPCNTITPVSQSSSTSNFKKTHTIP